MTALLWIAAGLAAFALIVTVINLLTWPRGRADGRFSGRISVLIPARDEQDTIARAVKAAAVGHHPVHEIVVYDDGSTDDTAAILDRLQAQVPTLRVLRGDPLPEGWVGKPHACHRLAQAAEGDLLLFVDADTILSLEGVARVVSLLEDHAADVVTAVPRQSTRTFFEHLVLPLLHLTYTAWLPLALIPRLRDPRVLAANGQVLAFRRAAYEAIGGFEAVRTAVVDDMAICRRAKEAGHRVVFADGGDLARTRMYASARQVWEGFSKNLYEGIGGRPGALLAVSALYALAFVVPWIALPAALLGASSLLAPALLGVGANLLTRSLLALRYDHRATSVLLHPVGVLALLGIALNSWRWSRRGAITWAGRTYAASAQREEAPSA